MKHALAIDLGASTGRAILGALDGGKLTLNEVHRFENLPRDAQGAFRWDLGALCKEIDAALAKVKEICVPDAIGIDTWGVDFGLLDEAGELLEEPLHYRDPSSIGMVESFCKRVCEKELYERTGLQLMRINSLFQLEAARLKRPEIFSRARKILMMPSLIARHLTGESKNEYTALSTSQLIDVRTKTPCEPVLNALGLTPDFCGTILKPGEIFGTLLPSYGLGAVPSSPSGCTIPQARSPRSPQKNGILSIFPAAPGRCSAPNWNNRSRPRARKARTSQTRAACLIRSAY